MRELKPGGGGYQTGEFASCRVAVAVRNGAAKALAVGRANFKCVLRGTGDDKTVIQLRAPNLNEYTGDDGSKTVDPGASFVIDLPLAAYDAGLARGRTYELTVEAFGKKKSRKVKFE